MGGGDDWASDKDGAFQYDDWMNISMIPPGSAGYDNGTVYQQGGCRIGYLCHTGYGSSPNGSVNRIRATCIPASGATVY